MTASDPTAAALWRADVESPGILLKRSYVQIGGDIVVGSLLSQIVYWHRPDKRGKTKLRVMRDGDMWIAKTREGWMEECAITAAGYRRAIQILKDRRIIEVRVMKFNGIAMNHVRLCEERLLEELVALSVASKEYERSGERAPTDQEKFTQSDCVNSSQPLTESTHESTAVSISCTASSTRAKAENEELTTKSEQERKGKEEKAEAFPSKDLGAFWTSLVTRVYGASPKPVTHKERGQLKKLRADLTEERFYPVVQYAVENWTKFSLEARYAAGLSCNPQMPGIGYLLRHERTAWELWDQQVQSASRDKEIAAANEARWAKEAAEYKQRACLRQDEDEDSKPWKPTVEEAKAELAKLGVAYVAKEDRPWISRGV
jgi:hypothetical protein